MQRINNVFYPVLNFIGHQILEGCTEMKPFYEKVKRENLTDEELDVIKDGLEITKEHNVDVNIYKLKSPELLHKLSLFAISRNDQLAWDIKGIQFARQLSGILWNPMVYKETPEIVPRKLWDDAYEFGKGFDDWLKEKYEKGYNASGIMIRPEEKVCEVYHINYSDKDSIETSVVLFGNCIKTVHCNFGGLISEDLKIPEEINEIAAMRKESAPRAYFQEDMYNILRLLHYKEKTGIKPKLYYRGDVIRYGDEQYEMFTDTACQSYELIRN